MLRFISDVWVSEFRTAQHTSKWHRGMCITFHIYAEHYAQNATVHPARVPVIRIQDTVDAGGGAAWPRTAQAPAYTTTRPCRRTEASHPSGESDRRQVQLRSDFVPRVAPEPQTPPVQKSSSRGVLPQRKDHLSRCHRRDCPVPSPSGLYPTAPHRTLVSAEDEARLPPRRRCNEGRVANGRNAASRDAAVHGDRRVRRRLGPLGRIEASVAAASTVECGAIWEVRCAGRHPSSMAMVVAGAVAAPANREGRVATWWRQGGTVT